jgi:molybdopterin-binding protein
VKLYDLKDLVFRRNARFTLRVNEFSVESGEKVALVGQNGSGKTTLLRVLAFLERPDTWARFLYKNQPYTGKLERSGLGFLKQQPYLFHGTVAQNLAYPLKLRRLPSQDVRRRVDAMLAMMELQHLAHVPAQDLSGGEQKRLALGRVLIADPDSLLLDEPTSHLDVKSRSVIEDVLKKTEKTILLTTHDLPFALRVTYRVLHMREGRVSTSLPENILEGRRDRNVLETGNGLSIELPADSPLPKQGESMTILIDPYKLRLSLEPLSSRPLNQFRGRVSSVREQGNDVWLKVDCGARLTAIISRTSYEEMGINLHREVILSFDAKGVEVL